MSNQKKAKKVMMHRSKPPVQIEPFPPTVGIQVYEMLTAHGFSTDEARVMARDTAAVYTSSSQRVFQFSDAVTLEISAGRVKLLYGTRNHETPRRTLERIQVCKEIELDKRARRIREQRLRDERRSRY